MTPKSKEFEIDHSLYIMSMLNCFILIFLILQDGPHIL